MRLTLPALLLLLAPGTAWAADAPSVYTIEVEGQERRTAVKVVPRADGTVVVTDADGHIEYLPAPRIRAIVDAEGVDWTTPVIRDREQLPPKKAGSAPQWKSNRLRPGPGSECGSYLITESSILRRVGSTEAGLGNGYAVIEYGYAKNAGRTFSLGGTTFAGMTEENAQVGFRFRLAKWLSKDVSFNLSPGIVATGWENDALDEFLGPQFTLQASLIGGGVFGLTFETYTVGRREFHNSYVDPPEEIHETFTAVGVRLGGLPGILGTIPTFIVGALQGIRD